MTVCDIIVSTMISLPPPPSGASAMKESCLTALAIGVLALAGAGVPFLPAAGAWLCGERRAVSGGDGSNHEPKVEYQNIPLVRPSSCHRPALPWLPSYRMFLQRNTGQRVRSPPHATPCHAIEKVSTRGVIIVGRGFSLLTKLGHAGTLPRRRKKLSHIYAHSSCPLPITLLTFNGSLYFVRISSLVSHMPSSA